MKGKKILSILAILIFMCLFSLETNAAEIDLNAKMMIKQTCNVYYKKSWTDSSKAGKISFGTEVTVKEYGEKWSKIKYDGVTRYISTSNLQYISYTVKDTEAFVRKGAYSTTSSKAMGCVTAGTKVSMLGVKTGKNGKEYMHCLISKMYTTASSKTNVEGYLPMSALEITTTPKVAKTSLSLYSKAFSSSDPASVKKAVKKITAWEKVEIISSKGSWSKVKYNNKVYYMYNTNLADEVRYVTYKTTYLREQPDSTSDSVKKVYWNTPLTILDEYKNGSTTWYFCEAAGTKGFIKKTSTGYNTKMITKATVTLRKKADSTSDSLGTVYAGKEVKVIYSAGGWAKVIYGNKTGFIYGTNLKYPDYQANGRLYSSAKKLINSSSGKVISENVMLIAYNKSYNYAYVKRDDGSYGWMRFSKLKEDLLNQVVYVNKRWISIYNNPITSSKETYLPYTAELTLVKRVTFGKTGSWYQIKYNESMYYIWVTDVNATFTEAKPSYTFEGENEYQQAVLDLVSEFLTEWKTIYKSSEYEGNFDKNGNRMFDCSGFVSYVLKNGLKEWNPNYWVSATLKTMYGTECLYNEGLNGEFSVEYVSLNEAKPGDVLFFDLEFSDGIVDHCGMYVGNGEFVHCTHSSWNSGVCLMPLAGGYADQVIDVGRFIPEKFESADTVYYTTSYVNLRESNDSGAEILQTLLKGSKVYVKNINSKGWAHIVTEDNVEGFVMSKYLSTVNITND